MSDIKDAKKHFKAMSLSISIGLVAVIMTTVLKSPILDPLLIALVAGIVLRTVLKFNPDDINGLKAAPMLFIPVGTMLYGAVNLNFRKFGSVNTDYLFMIFIGFIVYVIAVLMLSNLFKIKEKVSYLIASGSAICGASAIAITSKAVDAEPDDVSLSLISVFLSALIGLFVVLPLTAKILSISGIDYGVFAGALLQFTGFVKAAAAGLSSEAREIAITVKAVRYMGLLFLIPLFASFIKGKFYIPWFLWAFLLSGIVFSIFPDLSEALTPFFKPALTVLWSIAMAAIGLNANLKMLVTKEGLKVFCVSLLSFLSAVFAFAAGIICL